MTNFIIKPDQKRFLVHEAKVKETLAQLEARGEGSKADKTSSYHDSRLRALINRNSNSHTENNSSSRMIRAAILSVCPNLNLQSFKELTAETTILAGLEKDLLKYDEIQIPKRCKFGVITTQKGQTKEEAWFSNTGLSSEFKDFMNILGTKIELRGYTGYAAGLDIKTGETGKYSYVSKWNDVDIMFHVAPLMPFSKNDEQQIMRKRFIGNDVVCVVFIEGDQAFNPNAIRSQFIHVYILVRAEYVNVEVLRNSNVCDFGPPLPSPPLFYDADALKEFLTLKCKPSLFYKDTVNELTHINFI
ncbi:hypothetical protein EDC96DRAFT_446394 [Choanephora cucurbitarum]|nr:hypothetical protein EDC96DRAFT_446394 [Choanephora cucurbitarum]